MIWPFLEVWLFLQFNPFQSFDHFYRDLAILQFLQNFGHSLEILVIHQGSHRLEKYLNLEGFLEKSLKIKFALKSTGKHSKALKSP